MVNIYSKEELDVKSAAELTIIVIIKVWLMMFGNVQGIVNSEKII
jgi:hypothetical protein